MPKADQKPKGIPMPRNLANLSDDAFNDLVNADIRASDGRNNEPDLRDQSLRQPENLSRWREALLNMKVSIEYQLSTNKAERATKYAQLKGNENALLNFNASNEKWRTGALKFKSGVERRLNECNRLWSEAARDNNIAYLARERDVAVKEATKLREAILEHRDSLDSDEDKADDRLWSTLDAQRDFGV